jgi:dihydrofolate synthase/folylpolyglutamate synthase
MTYEEAIDWLYATQTFGIKLGLEYPTRLLREYLAFPPHTTKVIHVAGTNGKGSVCALAESVARAGGHRTGLFTSPHLVHYRERIRVSGVEIGEEETARHLTALRALVADWEQHPTFFEISLALALRHFRDRGCELLILETGMGGRLDATSAVPSDITVLTPIALDHQEWLGDTLGEIAGEKAAIMRHGKPAFSAVQEPEALAVIAEVANQAQAPLEIITEPLRGYSLGIAGEHQYANAALALAALHASGITLSYETVRHGLSTARHPGRFEIISECPGLPNPTVLDIAHNPHAAASLIATWQQMFPKRKATVLLGMVAAKDLAGVLALLCQIAERFLLAPVNSPRAVSPTEIAAALPADAPPHEIFPDLNSALTAAADSPALIITGSTFLVGEAKAVLEKREHRATEQ